MKSRYRLFCCKKTDSEVINLVYFIGFPLGNIIAAIVAVGILIGCVARKSITPIPLLIALVYFILSNLNIVPHVPIYMIVIAGLMFSAGLGCLFPRMDKRFGLDYLLGDRDED
jgi:hypothetical protein